MNLQKLFNMQKELDDYIIEKKCLQGVDLLPQKILSLQVELGELANEWRGFKFWSEDQEQRTKNPIKCEQCNGEGMEQLPYEPGSTVCESCKGKGNNGYYNPLLEEFVDCLHFILSIGNEMDYADSVYADLKEEINEPLEAFQHTFNWIVNLQYYWNGRNIANARRCYENLVSVFSVLGYQLGFTWNQIESAYTEKWNINKQRQENGY